MWLDVTVCLRSHRPKTHSSASPCSPSRSSSPHFTPPAPPPSFLSSSSSAVSSWTTLSTHTATNRMNTPSRSPTSSWSSSPSFASNSSSVSTLADSHVRQTISVNPSAPSLHLRPSICYAHPYLLRPSILHDRLEFGPHPSTRVVLLFINASKSFFFNSK